MIKNTILANVIVVPNPFDVILPNNYTYAVIVREYPDTYAQFVNDPSFDNILINLSSTNSTMDQT